MVEPPQNGGGGLNRYAGVKSNGRHYSRENKSLPSAYPSDPSLVERSQIRPQPTMDVDVNIVVIVIVVGIKWRNKADSPGLG